jgi:hypothetical protein
MEYDEKQGIEAIQDDQVHNEQLTVRQTEGFD